MPTGDPPSQPARRARGGSSWRARALFVAGMLVALLLCAEGALRFLLFNAGATALRWGGALRDPALFADPLVEDQYWRLRWAFDEESRGKPSAFDPLLGWTDAHLRPESYELVEPPPDDGRRPLVLFGSGQVACHAPGGACFREALELSPLAARFLVHDYSIGGQGLDQMYLLAREVLPRYRGRDPLVVVAIVAGADLERCNLAFRVWPKPLLTPRGEGLDLLPPAPSVQSFLERDGLGVRSFVWRGLLHGTDWLPRGLRDRLALGDRRRTEQWNRGEAVALAFGAELERQGVEHVFLVLHGPRTLSPAGATPTLFTADQPEPDARLLALLERAGLPHVDTRPFLEQAGLEQAGGAALFVPDEAGRSVPAPRAREAWLRALEQFAPLAADGAAR